MEVYRDGGFTLHLRPGRYSLTVIDVLTEERLMTKSLEVAGEPIQFHMDLGGNAKGDATQRFLMNYSMIALSTQEPKRRLNLLGVQVPSPCLEHIPVSCRRWGIRLTGFPAMMMPCDAWGVLRGEDDSEWSSRNFRLGEIAKIFCPKP